MPQNPETIIEAPPEDAECILAAILKQLEELDRNMSALMAQGEPIAPGRPIEVLSFTMPYGTWAWTRKV